MPISSWLGELNNRLGLTRRRRTCRRKPLASNPPRRPRLELLEDRLAPALVAWDGGGGDFLWTNALNWNNPGAADPNTLPGPADDVVIDIAGQVATITHFSSGVTSINSLTSQERITLSAGTLTIAADSTIAQAFTLSQGGTPTVFQGAGNLTIGGAFTWTGGTMRGPGETTAAGGITASGTGAKTLDGRSLNNLGTGSLVGGRLNMLNGAVLNNAAGTQLTLWDGVDIFDTGGIDPVINNAGSMHVFDTTFSLADSKVQAIFNNTGTVTIDVISFLDLSGGGVSTGTFNAPGFISFTGGTHLLQAGASFSNSDNVSLSAGTLEIAGAVTMEQLSMTGGTLSGAGIVTIGSLVWGVGSMQGTGKTIAGVTTGVGTSTRVLDGRTLDAQSFAWSAGGAGALDMRNGAVLNILSNSAWTSSGNLTMSDGAALNVLGFAQFEIKTDADILHGAGAAPTITTAANAHFRKTAGSGISEVQAVLQNGGFVDVTSGTLRFTRGGTSNRNFVPTSPGVLELAAGTYTLQTGAQSFGTGTVQIGGATLDVAADVSVTSKVALASGILTGAGAWNGSSNAFTWTGGTITGTGQTNNITLVVDGTANKSLDGRTLNTNSVQMRNTGNLIMSNGARINAAGSFLVQSDADILAGAGAAPTISSSGLFRKDTTAGTSTIQATFTNNSSGTLNVLAGTLNLSAGLTNFDAASGTLNGGAYQVTGTLQFPGANLLANTAPLTLSGAGSQIVDQFGANALTNLGANTAILTIQSGKTLTTAGGFTNSGTVVVGTSSNLALAPGSTYTQTAGKTTVTGGLNAALVDQQAGILEGKGTITANVVSAGQINAGTSPGILTVAGNLTLTPAAVVNMELGGLTAVTQHDRLAVTGSVTLDGTLNVTRTGTYMPVLGNGFTVLTFANRSGDFNATNGLGISTHVALTPVYDASSLSLVAAQVNKLPEAVDDLAVTDEDASVSASVKSNDSDADGDPITVAAVTQPSHGAVVLNADGSVTYTPAANFRGEDSFTYTLADNQGGSDTGTVTVTVRPINDAPVADAGADTIAAEGSIVSFNGADSSDVDGDTLSYSWTFGDGAIATGPTPTHIYADDGVYTVTLTVSDGQASHSDTLIVTVNIVTESDTSRDEFFVSLIPRLTAGLGSIFDDRIFDLLDGIEVPLTDELGFVNFVSGLGHGATAALNHTGWFAKLRSILGSPFDGHDERGEGDFYTLGDLMVGANLVRRDYTADAQPIDGRGVKIGVISDGILGLAQAQATGDAPVVNDLDLESTPSADLVGTGAEGTAMIEIIQDVAPGAELFFAAAGDDDYENAVRFLIETAQVDIIVSDVLSLPVGFELPRQTQAVADLLAAHPETLFIVAASNFGGRHYQAPVESTQLVVGGVPTPVHNFGFGAGVLQLELAKKSEVNVHLTWSDAASRRTREPKLRLLDASGNVLATGESNPHYPLSSVFVKNSSDAPAIAYLAIDLSGVDMDPADPPLVLELTGIGDGIRFLFPTPDNTSPDAGDAIPTEAALPGVLTVGAFHASNPNVPAAYSSAGPSTFLDPLTRTLVVAERTLDVMGPSMVSVSGSGGFDRPFLGTSAAAPHVAGVAALLMQLRPDARPADLIKVLRETAANMLEPGYDNQTGYGRVDAPAAAAKIVTLALPYQANVPIDSFVIPQTTVTNSILDPITDDASSFDPGDLDAPLQPRIEGIIDRLDASPLYEIDVPGAEAIRDYLAGTLTLPNLTTVRLQANPGDLAPLAVKFGFDASGIPGLSELGLEGSVIVSADVSFDIGFGLDGDGFYLTSDSHIDAALTVTIQASGGLGRIEVSATGTLSLFASLGLGPVDGVIDGTPDGKIRLEELAAGLLEPGLLTVSLTDDAGGDFQLTLDATLPVPGLRVPGDEEDALIHLTGFVGRDQPSGAVRFALRNEPLEEATLDGVTLRNLTFETSYVANTGHSTAVSGKVVIPTAQTGGAELELTLSGSLINNDLHLNIQTAAASLVEFLHLDAVGIRLSSGTIGGTLDVNLASGAVEVNIGLDEAAGVVFPDGDSTTEGLVTFSGLSGNIGPDGLTATVTSATLALDDLLVVSIGSAGIDLTADAANVFQVGSEETTGSVTVRIPSLEDTDGNVPTAAFQGAIGVTPEGKVRFLRPDATVTFTDFQRALPLLDLLPINVNALTINFTAATTDLSQFTLTVDGRLNEQHPMFVGLRAVAPFDRLVLVVGEGVPSDVLPTQSSVHLTIDPQSLRSATTLLSFLDWARSRLGLTIGDAGTSYSTAYCRSTWMNGPSAASSPSISTKAKSSPSTAANLASVAANSPSPATMT